MYLTEDYHSDGQNRKPIWWCALTDNFDHYPEWQVCPESETTYAGNEPGKKCHFPFLFKNKLHTTCIRSGGALKFDGSDNLVPIDDGISGYWWCSTTANFDRDQKWTRCLPQHAGQLPCYFPEEKNAAGGKIGGIRQECQAFAGHWVCQTELNQLRQCPSTPNPVVNPSTEGGNNPGFPCHFPFEATLPLLTTDAGWVSLSSKRNFTSCLPGIERSDEPMSIYPPWIGYWCSTTENFDKDKLWTRCAINGDLEIEGQKPYMKLFREGTLASLWTQFGWFKLLSSEEKSKIQPKNQVYSSEFQQSLDKLEKYRAQWDVMGNRDEPQWWTWLAPFWWTAFKNNQSKLANFASAYAGPYLHNSEESVDPLSKGFQFPRWVRSWNSAGWTEYGLSLRERWNNLTSAVRTRWRRTWLIAFCLGFAAALGMACMVIVLFYFCADPRRKKQLVILLCKSKKWKQVLREDVEREVVKDKCLYIPLDVASATYSAIEAHSQDSYNGRLNMPFRGGEECLKTHPHLQVTGEQCDSVCLLKLFTNQAAHLNGDRTSTNIGNHQLDETELGMCHKLSDTSKPDCCCWEHDNAQCIRNQQQLKDALEIILKILRAKGNLNSNHHLTDLQQLLELLLSRKKTKTEDGHSTLNSGLNHGSLQALREGRPYMNYVEPSAPPPSYDQVTE
ncbi:unnamed protein product [Calicophoron daubneyi]|uniref:Fibronectin type-II domain-containing protein n=1 Tax=Calicophoron daubneyi TaxID=300641 RepID=A0AAV2T033_CALDB